MNDDPKRLLLEHDDADLGALLRAGKSDLPNEHELGAIAMKLGIAGGLGGAGAAGAAGGGGIGAKAIAGGTVKAALAIKIGGAVAVASALGAGAVVVATREPTLVERPLGIVATAKATSSVLAPSAGPALPHVEDAPPIPSDKPTPKPPIARAEGEVRMLERAQDALRARPTEALAICEAHARAYPRGMLAQEREAIAIEALVRSGQKAEGRARADRFAKTFPGSTHLRRIESLVE